jgi:hypothetical protein
MTLAPGIGSALSFNEAGTRPRNSSSCEDKTLGSSSYQDPAWLASRVVMMFRRVYDLSLFSIVFEECTRQKRIL